MSNEAKPLVDDMRAWLESDTDRVIAERDKLAASHAELVCALEMAISAVETGKASWAGCADFLESATNALTRAKEIQP